MKKKHIYAMIALLCATTASAQIQSTYFLDNYTFTYRDNPANMPDKSFVGVGIGNIEAGAGSSIGLSSLLYPSQSGSGLVTGFNAGVGAEEFLSRFADKNALSANANLNIFSLGLRKKSAMTTVELNSRTIADGTVSGDLFRFLKVGGENRSYNFSSTALGAASYIELAVGRARRVGATFSFGWRVKGLMGIAGASANLQDSRAALSGEQIEVAIKGTAALAGSLLQFKTDEEGRVCGVERGHSFSPAGFGAAFDAGISWNPLDDLTLSASIADLGFIRWNQSCTATADNSVTYAGVEISGSEEGVKDEVNKVMDDFCALTDIKIKYDNVSSSKSLPMRINAAARYRIPTVESLSAGALFTFKNSAAPVFDARAAVTFTHKKWFSVTANLGGSTLGMVWGGAVSLCAPFLNFFAGIDSYVGTMTSEFIPVDKFNCRVNLGLALRFGGR